MTNITETVKDILPRPFRINFIDCTIIALDDFFLIKVIYPLSTLRRFLSSKQFTFPGVLKLISKI